MQADTRFAEAVAEHGAEASNISFKNILFAHHRILEPKKSYSEVSSQTCISKERAGTSGTGTCQDLQC